MNTRDPDDKLVSQLRQSLDQCARQTDSDFEARLDALAQQAGQTRRQRLSAHPKTLGLALIGFALAAGLAVVSIVPSALIKPAPQATVVTPAATVPSVDPEFLEDMDMLIALGEDNHDS
jgi:hypothetical protein